MNPRRGHRSAVDDPAYQFMLRRLREARKESGLTQWDVARALGRRQSYVTKSELGERRIDPVELQAFARLYEKRIEYFLPPAASRRSRRPQR